MTPSQRDNLLEAHSQAMARIAELKAERDALKTELHQWEESDAARSVLEPVFTVEIGRLEEENARLRKIIEDAPHDPGCTFLFADRHPSKGCDCWKAALARIPEVG